MAEPALTASQHLASPSLAGGLAGLRIAGPRLDAQAQCEAVLRTLPMWFGIEEALLMYARDSALLPGFAAMEGDAVVGFISLMQHFPQAWEVHCIAVAAPWRNKGVGRALSAHAEAWLAAQGVAIVQAKTVAATSPDAYYAQTREFYARLGYAPLEVFPLLWAPQNPALQLVKFLQG